MLEILLNYKLPQEISLCLLASCPTEPHSHWCLASTGREAKPSPKKGGSGLLEWLLTLSHSRELPEPRLSLSPQSPPPFFLTKPAKHLSELPDPVSLWIHLFSKGSHTTDHLRQLQPHMGQCVQDSVTTRGHLQPRILLFAAS